MQRKQEKRDRGRDGDVLGNEKVASEKREMCIEKCEGQVFWDKI